MSIVSLGDSVVMELGQGIGSQLVGLAEVIDTLQMLLFLLGKKLAGLLELLTETLVIKSQSSLNILVHQSVVSQLGCSFN